MSAREDILSAIRARRLALAPAPEPYAALLFEGDSVTRFSEHAQFAHTEVRIDRKSVV